MFVTSMLLCFLVGYGNEQCFEGTRYDRFETMEACKEYVPMPLGEITPQPEMVTKYKHTCMSLEDLGNERGRTWLNEFLKEQEEYLKKQREDST